MWCYGLTKGDGKELLYSSSLLPDSPECSFTIGKTVGLNSSRFLAQNIFPTPCQVPALSGEGVRQLVLLKVVSLGSSGGV